MIEKSIVKMLCVLVLCPVLLVAVQTLTIDSQLGTSVEDCFERISIGEQLPPDAIYRNVSELTTRECETICKQDKQCQTYDYGVGAKGNATCNLSTLSEKELKEKNILRRHPDYDVYIRRFQCEQSPPSPLQPQFDDPGDGSGPGPGPAHRPVFRPDEDEAKRPLDDYPTDSRPYETIRPDLLKPLLRPPTYHNYLDHDRPDDYNQRPPLDNPPSYGAHRPPEIPYRPNRPYEIRPPVFDIEPYQNHTHYQSDPYDVLHFQEPYRPSRPADPGYWRPDPYSPPHLTDDIQDIYGPKPIRPHRPNDIGQNPYGLEKPEYHYIVRPNRRPRPENSYGGKPDYSAKPDPYAPSGASEYFKPNYDYPYRPYNKPSYSYNSNYASNYGQSEYQDNSIYLEIIDPPRPYKPTKRPVNDRPGYGQGQDYSSNYGYNQGSYGYDSQNSYGQGTITEIGNSGQNYNKPQDTGYSRPKPGYRPPESDQRPQKPGYGSQNSGYGNAADNSPGYGAQTQKPSDVTQKPSYSSQGSYASNQASYGTESHSDTSYGSQSYGGSNRPIYSSSQDDNQGGYGIQKPQKPSDTTQRPSYGNQGSYGGNQPSYGGSASNDNINHVSYGSQGSYGSNQQSYAEHHDSHYSSQQSGQYYGSYGVNRPSYSRPTDNDNRPSYEGHRPSHSDYRPTYEDNRPSYGENRPSNEQPSYGSNRPSYSDVRPLYDDHRPSYGDSKPSFDDRPSYGDVTPLHDSRPLYGDAKPPNDNRPSYGVNKPSYNNHRPSYDNKPGYGDTKPTYGSNPLSYGDNRPPYDNNRPDPPSQSGYGNPSDVSSGYGGEEYKNSHLKPTPKPVLTPVESRPNRTELDRPGIKPVYEYELERPNNVPSYIVRPGGEVVTSRPVAVGDIGRHPGRPVSYKETETNTEFEKGSYKTSSSPQVNYDRQI